MGKSVAPVESPLSAVRFKSCMKRRGACEGASKGGRRNFSECIARIVRIMELDDSAAAGTIGWYDIGNGCG